MPTAHTFSAESEDSTLIVTPLRSVAGLVEEDVRGELAPILERLGTAELKHAVIDFHELTYFGTSMLEAMFAIWRRIRDDEGKMILCNVSTMGREILRVSRFDTLWPICDTREDALREIGG